MRERKFEDRFWSKVDIRGDDDCWPWKAARDHRGYGWINIGGPMRRAHTIAYRLKRGEPNFGNIVRHSCDNPPCCNPRHLIEGTQKQNMEDAAERKRFPSRIGENNIRAKLTEEIVLECRARYVPRCRKTAFRQWLGSLESIKKAYAMLSLEGRGLTCQTCKSAAPKRHGRSAPMSRWNDDRIAMLLECADAQMTTCEIVDRFGGIFTRNAIIGKLHRLRATAGQLPGRNGRRMRVARDNVKSQPAIAKPKQEPAMEKKPRWSEDGLRRLGELTAARVSRVAIAAEFGCSVKTIESRLKIERANGNPLIPASFPSIKQIPVEKRGRRGHRGSDALREARHAAIEAANSQRLASLFDEGHGVPLLDLGLRQCRFATGFSVEVGGHLFCGARTPSANRPYCEHHHAIAYVPRKIIGGKIKSKLGLTEFARIRVEVRP